MNKKTMYILCCLLLMSLSCSSNIVKANDMGVFQHFLNVDAKLPSIKGAITAEDAVKAVTAHIQAIKNGEKDGEPGLKEYWSDYRAILNNAKVSSAKPVFIDLSHEGEKANLVVARFLVGLKVNGAVGGFFAVDPVTGSIQSDLMWTMDLRPLWMVPALIWNKAGSVNEIETLEELVPPYTQFTTGIPVDPYDTAFNIVDGVVDALPLKCQEERSERVNWFNNEFGTSLQVTLNEHVGRRTGTSKCMSIAASYLGDWWTVRTGNDLPVYTNGVGGQKEYGFNPRLLECRFFEKAADRHFLGKYIGNFKVAPMSTDRVTGEKVPYSPRGYARILTETDKGETPDALVKDAMIYKTNDNNFSMDQKPHIAQIFTDGFFPSRAIKKDLKNSRDSDFPFTLMSDYGSDVTVSYIQKMIDTWGPLYGQHMGRNKDGSAKTSRFGMGVHCIMIIGTGTVQGHEMIIYRDTFGNASMNYLEDSFLCPAFRAMPIEYFYQAMAFPHHLYVDIHDVKVGEDACLSGLVSVKTNRDTDLIDVDSIEIYVDGHLSANSRANRVGKGQYRLWLPTAELTARTIEVRVSKKYFADKEGNGNFTGAVKKTGNSWSK